MTSICAVKPSNREHTTSVDRPPGTPSGTLCSVPLVLMSAPQPTAASRPDPVCQPAFRHDGRLHFAFGTIWKPVPSIAPSHTILASKTPTNQPNTPSTTHRKRGFRVK